MIVCLQNIFAFASICFSYSLKILDAKNPVISYDLKSNFTGTYFPCVDWMTFIILVSCLVLGAGILIASSGAVIYRSSQRCYSSIRRPQPQMVCSIFFILMKMSS